MFTYGIDVTAKLHAKSGDKDLLLLPQVSSRAQLGQLQDHRDNWQASIRGSEVGRLLRKIIECRLQMRYGTFYYNFLPSE